MQIFMMKTNRAGITEEVYVTPSPRWGESDATLSNPIREGLGG
jgi:hypothetical protein